MSQQVAKHDLQAGKRFIKNVFGHYFSWTLITLCTIGISLPSTLKTTISPALMGSSRKLVKNNRSPLWNAGSMLPLWKKDQETKKSGVHPLVSVIYLFGIFHNKAFHPLQWPKRVRGQNIDHTLSWIQEGPHFIFPYAKFNQSVITKFI